jgi:hypothetical protein
LAGFQKIISSDHGPYGEDEEIQKSLRNILNNRIGEHEFHIDEDAIQIQSIVNIFIEGSQ